MKKTEKAEKKVVAAPEKKASQVRELQGEVVMTGKMAKTITVRVNRTRLNEKYGKRYGVSRKYLVHDDQGGYQIGDVVTFVETRPYSATKRWRVTGKVTKA